MKKISAILLSIAMIISMIPIGIIGFAASDNSQQIEAQGGTSSTPDERITISKSVSATEDENYFDITLSVVQELPATDIVLVMDISNTMNQNHNGEQTTVVADKRLTKAKNAASAFLDEYSKTTGICKNRRIGMVQFNTNASKVFDLGNVNDNLADFKSKIDDITAPGGDNRFTNIEAGLQLAANMLKTSTAKQKYIILITDGFPTTYIETGRNSTDSIQGYDVYRTWNNKPASVPSAPQDGLFYDFVKKVPCNGTSYSDTAAIKARTLATDIKNSDINIYTIGIDISNESQTIQRYIDALASNKSSSIVERTGSTYEVGSATDSTAYVNWLGTKLSGGSDLENAGVTNAFSRGDTVDQLNTAFDTVLSYILGSEPLTVTDPMGDNIEFLGFYDKNGALSGSSLNGSHVENGEDTAAFTDKISWNINTSGYNDVTTKSETTRTYSVKYRVRLTNEANGFVGEKAYNTNGRTVLNYVFSDHTNKTLDFIVPSVEGYFGSFEFFKADKDTSEALEGAVFTLTHKAACSVCGGKVAIDAITAESNSNGKVSFASVPSGHEYTLSETKAPEGYVANSDTYSVKIEYGKVFIDGAEVSSDFTINNKAFVPATVNIIGSKKLSGGDKNDADILAGQFKFSVENNNSKGVSGVPAQVETAAGGKIDFGTWSFSIPGTYTFTVSENNLGNAGYGYDSSSVTVTVTVSVDESGEKLEAVTAISKNGAAADKVEFSNTYTAPEAITNNPISGDVTLTENGKPKDIEDKQFDVSIKADPSNNTNGYEADVPSTVPADSNGDFDFPEIEFKKPGSYSFVITENNKGAAGYGYDGSEYVVTYTVTLDETTNTLVITDTVITKDGEPADRIVFNNTYETPAPVELPVTGITTLTGGGKTSNDITEGFFGYVVSGGSQDGVSDVPATTSSKAGGALDFGTWKFSKEGTYTFTVNENTPPAGYTDETGEVTVTVTVTLNKETNKLEAQAKFSSGENLKIDNTYVAPDPITVALKGNKTLTGQKSTDDIADGDFTFKVWADENNNSDGFIGFGETASVKKGGAIDFGSATFSKAGIYQFAVTENNLGKTGYSYDNGICYVTVTVTLDTVTNTLSSVTEITKNGAKIDEIIFENVYTPIAVSDELVFSKNIIGLPLISSDFTFVLKADDVQYPMPSGSVNGEKTASVTGEGEAAFGKITFTHPGVYSYTVSEVNKKTLGYIYDRTVYEVKYTVTDVDGVLEAERVISADGEVVDETVFRNLYIPPIIPIIPIVPVFPIIPIIPEMPELPESPNLPGDSEIDKPSDGNIGETDEPVTDDSNNSEEDIPYTGSESAVVCFAMLCILICAAFSVLFIRKKKVK